MSKKYMIYGIIAIVLAVFGYWVYSNQRTPQIIETRDFSCPGWDMSNMTGFTFTFKYPVFKEWPNVTANAQNCEIIVKTKGDYTFAKVHINQGFNSFFPAESAMKNQYGVYYTKETASGQAEENWLRFRTGDDNHGAADVGIRLELLPIIQTGIMEKFTDQFFQIVIDSFRIKPES